MATLETIKTIVKRVPGVRQYQEQAYEQRFATDLYGSFRGVYRTFDQARASAPKTKPLGFDSKQFAEEYRERMQRIYDYDYPVLFWLRDLLTPETRLFDLGGHVGVQCYAYSKYLDFPAGLRWVVCEVPEIAQRGAELAREQGRRELSFTSRFEDGDGCDVFLSAGAIHYIEAPALAEIIGKYATKPRHLLLNKVPLYDGPPFVTLQNAGVSFVPQQVFNRGQLVSSIEQLGYRLVDQWNDRIHSCRIPFQPERSVEHYSGLYFRHGSA